MTPQLPPDDPTSLLPKKLVRARPLFDPEIVRKATAASFAKLNPVTLLKNPVMFVVEVGAAITTVFLIRDLFTGGGSIGFQVQISLWLWFTVLFANFAEAMAEARGKAQADALRKTKTDVIAKRLTAAGKMEQVSGLPVANRRHRDLRRQRSHSRRRRGDRGRRNRGRIGDHRRKRAGHSRIRRRPQRGYRRHSRPVGSNQDQDHFQPRRDVPRPHDRPGRGRPAPEDAE